MTLTKFKNLPGATPLEKLTTFSNGRPIYTQIKYNGVFCHWSKEKQTAFTGTNKQWDLGRFPILLMDHLIRAPYDLYGELLIPNKPLPEIAGAVNVNSNIPFPADTFLHVFDVIDKDESWLFQPISARLQMMADLSYPEKENIRTADTWLFTPELADNFFAEVTDLGHEGLVYRRNPCFPVFTDSPHPDMVKRKKVFTTEGTCIGVTEGKGKRKGMLGYLTLRLANGRPLKVGGGPGMTDAVLKQLYDNPPLSKQVTFSYEELGPSNIPLRPQFVAVRNYE